MLWRKPISAAEQEKKIEEKVQQGNKSKGSIAAERSGGVYLGWFLKLCKNALLLKLLSLFLVKNCFIKILISLFLANYFPYLHAEAFNIFTLKLSQRKKMDMQQPGNSPGLLCKPRLGLFVFLSMIQTWLELKALQHTLTNIKTTRA